MPQTHYVSLADSHRVPLQGALVVGTPNPTQRLSVTVYVRRKPTAPTQEDVIAAALVPPTKRKPLDDEAFTAAVGADPADIAAVEEFAHEAGLDVVGVNQTARSVRLEGTVAALSAAFRVSLARYSYRDRSGRARVYRGRVGPLYVPQRLETIVTAVVGLDDRPVGDSLYVREDPGPGTTLADAESGPRLPAGTFLPPTLGTLYGFPENTDGTGQCIAVLAFNGESAPGKASGGYRAEALRTYFADVLGQPMPEIVDVVVHGPGNDPGKQDKHSDRLDSTGEIMLDLQMIGALAPGAKIVVYFTVFTEQGWADAISAIVTDTVNRPSVISCSYGNPEDLHGARWTPMTIKHVDQTLADAALKHVTICCASGDDGSRDQGNDFRSHADYPASSPFVLGVGGTRLVANGSQIESETVWDDQEGSTGGGVSRAFPVPSWQSDARVPVGVDPPHNPGRGVPDVAALADPETGIMVIAVDGVHGSPAGGTSAAAPLWAALVARLNQALGANVGYLNPLLYSQLAEDGLRDITSGNNGAYPAGPGWDACTGLGSPDGTGLLKGLKGL